MKQYLLAIFVALSLVLAACTPQTAPTEQPSEELVVGGILPLSGGAAEIGLAMKQAVDAGVDEVNAAGGVDGKKLVIKYEDGACSGKEAASVATKLATVDKVRFIFGAGCSGESIAAVPVAEEHKVLMFSSTSSSPVLTGISPYFVRNYPSDASAGIRIAQAAYADGHRKVAVVSENTDYAQAYLGEFVETFEELGGTIVANEKYEQDATVFRTQLTKAQNAKPEALMIIPQTPNRGALLAKQIAELKLNLPLFGNDIMEGEETLAQAEGGTEGMKYATGAFDAENPKAKKLFAALEAKHGAIPSGLPPLYLAAGYDAPFLFKAAYESCKSMDPKCLGDHLRSVKGYNGAVGVVEIGSNGDPVFDYELRQIKDGKPVVLS